MIGIFDSGFGGLTTLRELLRLAPQYDFLFLGDNARVPYGNRSVETITKFAEEGVNFLFERGAKIVLIACNTASSDALRFLQMKYPDRKILGVLIPAVESALERTRFGRIGIVGTRRTIATKNYEKELTKRTPLCYAPQDHRAEKIPRISSNACPLLVPLIEENWSHKPETRMILKKYLLPLKHANVDTLILGCTHYPLIEGEFLRRMGKSVTIINSGKAQAEKTLDYLARHPKREQTLSRNRTIHFFTTDDPERFRELGERFLGTSIGKKSVEKVEIEK